MSSRDVPGRGQDGVPLARTMEKLLRYAWLPIPLFLAAIAVLWFAEFPYRARPPFLLPTIGSAFSTLIALLTAWLIARHFTRSAYLPLLPLGCGVLLFGAGTFISAVAFHVEDTALALTVHNTAVFLAGACHILAAAALAKGQTVAPHARLILFGAYGAVLFAVALLSYVALVGPFPIPFIPPEGQAPFRYGVLGSAVTLFALAAMMMFPVAHRRNWLFGKWHALALALVATGLFGILASPEPGTLVGFAGRSAQYLGGLYFLGALLAAHGGRDWDTAASSALRESQEQLRALFDNMSEGFAVGEPILNPDGAASDFRFIMINRAFELQTGLDQSVLGRPIREVLPSVEDHWIERYCRVALFGEPIRFEDFNRDLNRWFEVLCYQAAPGRFAILFTDITDRRRAEKDLITAKEANEQNLARLNAIVNQMTEGLVVFDPEGNLVEMNPAALAIHGFSDVASLRRHLEQLDSVFELFDLEGNCLPTNEWPIGRALKGETFSAYNVRVRRLDSGKSWVGSYGGAPVFDERGRMLFAIVTVRDITQQYEAERILKESRDELDRRVRERTAELQERADQLARLTSELTLAEQRERGRLAQILHDHLQQLLVGAKLGLDVLNRKAGEEQQKTIREIEGLLDESITTSRSLTVELSPPILHEGGLAAGVEWLARSLGDKHGLTVALDVDPSIKCEREDVRLLVFQALRELLFNVVKHARTTRASVQLARHDARQLRAVVEDQGVGFEIDEIRNNSPRASQAFGLFSIRQRLDLLGGRLEIESSPGKGSRLTLLAPLEEQRTPERAITPPSPAVAGREEKPPSPSPRGKIRLLVVDDHAIVRHGLTSMLSYHEDLEIIGEARNGTMGIELARSLQPDVILMDFSMPDMDGVEATRAIHTELPDIRIVGLSMYEESDRAKAMITAGAVAYLTKSGQASALLETIREVATN